MKNAYKMYSSFGQTLPNTMYIIDTWALSHTISKQEPYLDVWSKALATIPSMASTIIAKK